MGRVCLIIRDVLDSEIHGTIVLLIDGPGLAVADPRVVAHKVIGHPRYQPGVCGDTNGHRQDDQEL